MDGSGSDSSARPSPVDDILAHWGKMGMHWGRRKSRETTSVPNDSGDPTEVKLYSKRGKGVTGVSGGEKRLPSSDAKNAIVYKQIASKSGVHSLSNEQLRALTNRLDLEQKYSKILVGDADKQRSAGSRFAKDLIGKERNAMLSAKKGPILLAVGALMTAYGVAGGKHRSDAYPLGAFKRTSYVGKHAK